MELTGDSSSKLNESETLAQRFGLAPGQILNFIGSDSRLEHPHVVFDSRAVDHLLEDILPTITRPDDYQDTSTLDYCLHVCFVAVIFITENSFCDYQLPLPIGFN